MAFWRVVGLSVEHDDGGRATRAFVLDGAFESWMDAAIPLWNKALPWRRGRVIEANVYVAEADTAQQASALVASVLDTGEPSARVLLVQKNIPTRPVEEKSPEYRALHRIHGELCISYQLADLAREKAETDRQRETLRHHISALVDFDEVVRMMRDEQSGESGDGPGGQGGMGCSSANVGGSVRESFAAALTGLAGELSIAQYEAGLAVNMVASPSRRDALRERIRVLSLFLSAVEEMQAERETES